jgi:hypothetical protein
MNALNSNQADWTYGAELEIGDINTRLELPPGNLWDRRDSTICNSSGLGNDPRKQLVKYGSEINTKPCHSPEELVAEVLGIYKVFPRYSFNYTTNLHVHIRIPGLRDDLKALQAIVRYLHQHATYMFELVDPIEKPLRSHYTAPEQYKAAMRRYRRRLVSHWNQVKPNVYPKLLLADTIDYFRTIHRLSPKGNLLPPALTVRAAVNLLQLWDTDTIEFRHFTMTDDPKRLLSAFTWPKLFIEAVIGNTPPGQVMRDNSWLRFQPVLPFLPEMDLIFQMTNFRHNTRNEVHENHLMLLGRGVIFPEDLQ